jgi:hypothetical protein
VGIGGDEMDEAFAEHPFTAFLALRAKRTAQTTGRDLQQATNVYELWQQLGLTQDSLVPLGVRKDSGNPPTRQLIQQWLQREIQLVRQFQENVPPMIAQR